MGGVVVCSRWGDFAAFIADMGERPAGRTLDRIDNARGYEPGNCRWATPAEQARNSANAKLEAHEPAQIEWLSSEGYTNVEIARFYEVSTKTVARYAGRR